MKRIVPEGGNAMKKTMIAISAVLLLAGSAMAAGSGGTPDEAKALVEKAVALIQSDGRDRAFAAFNDPKGAFVMKDLYIFVVDMQGNILAHGANAALIGKNLMGLKDMMGKRIIKDMLDMAGKSPEGWIDYKWMNPVTQAIGDKSTYYRKAGDILVCCGVYR
jgi:signal transduction histidine kinase